MRIFNAIFLKKKSLLRIFFKKYRLIRPTHYATIFPISDFCRWGCGSRHFVFRSFVRMQKKEFLKNSHQLSRYQLFHYRLFFIIIIIYLLFFITGNAGRLLELHNVQSYLILYKLTSKNNVQSSLLAAKLLQILVFKTKQN